MTFTQVDLPRQQTSQTSNHKDVPNNLNDAERAIINQQLIELLHGKLLSTTRNAIAHRLTAQRWKQIDVGINLPCTILAAFSGASALSNFDKSRIIVGVFTLIVTVLTSINTFLKPSDNSNEHLRLAVKYGSLRNEIYRFLALKCIEGEKDGERQFRPIDQKGSELTQEIHQSFEKLVNEISELDTKTPPFRWATNQARKAAFREDKKTTKMNPPKPG